MSDSRPFISHLDYKLMLQGWGINLHRVILHGISGVPEFQWRSNSSLQQKNRFQIAKNRTPACNIHTRTTWTFSTSAISHLALLYPDDFSHPTIYSPLHIYTLYTSFIQILLLFLLLLLLLFHLIIFILFLQLLPDILLFLPLLPCLLLPFVLQPWSSLHHFCSSYCTISCRSFCLFNFNYLYPW